MMTLNLARNSAFSILTLLLLFSPTAHAAPDTGVTLSKAQAKCLLRQINDFNSQRPDITASVTLYTCPGVYGGGAKIPSDPDDDDPPVPVATLRADQLICAAKRIRAQLAGSGAEVVVDFDGCPDGK